MSPRIIEWCQGNTYELAAASDGLDVAVVISHDCDLRSEKETNVEIIRSGYISSPNARILLRDIVLAILHRHKRIKHPPPLVHALAN